MGRTQERIEAVIGAKDDYSRALRRFQSDFKAGFQKVARSAKTFALVATAATAAVSAAMIAVSKSTANAGDAFQKMSLRTGVSAEALSELKHAAEISGASIEDVETGFKILSKRMLDAQNGLAESKRTFDRLGLSINTSSGHLRDADAVFMDAVTAINNLSSSTEQAALAQELFGRSGTQLLPLMKTGREGIAELRAAARDLGITFTDVEANQAAAFNDSLLEVGRSFSGLKNTIGKAFIPSFTVLMDEARDKMIELKKSGDLDVWAANVSAGVIVSFAAVAEFFTNLPLVWNASLNAFKTFGAGIIAVIQAITIPLQKYYELWASIPRLGKIWQDDAEKLKNLNKTLEDAAVKLLVGAAANEQSGIAWAQWQIKAIAAIEEVKKKAIAAKKNIDALSPGAPTGGSGEDTGTPTNPKANGGNAGGNGLADQLAAIEEAKAELQRLNATSPIFVTPDNELVDFQAVLDTKLAMVDDHNAQVRLAMFNSGASIDAMQESFLQMEINREKSITSFKIQMAGDAFGAAANFMQNLTVITGKEGGAMFEIMKGFATAQALIKTYEAANFALAGPFPFNLINAAFVTAAGLARVAQIQRTQPGATSGNSVGVGGTTNPGFTGGANNAGPPPIPVTQADNQGVINVQVQVFNPMSDTDFDKLVEDDLGPALERATGRKLQFV